MRIMGAEEVDRPSTRTLWPKPVRALTTRVMACAACWPILLAIHAFTDANDQDALPLLRLALDRGLADGGPVRPPG